MSDQGFAARKQYVDEMPQSNAAGEIFIKTRASFFTLELVGRWVLLDDLDEGALSKGSEVRESTADYLVYKTPLVAIESTGGS